MATKKTIGTTMTKDEQQLWDNVVINLIQQGKDAGTASDEAHAIIKGRRGK